MTAELQFQLQASALSPIVTSSVIQTELNNAYAWAGRQFKWPALKAARTADTNEQANYDYPTDFQPESITRVEIAGLTNPVFERKDFEDYLDYTENFPTNTDQIFANYWTQFFIFPIQVANPGSSNMSIWGYKNVTPMVNTTDVTIFSNYDPLANMAIVKQAKAVIQAPLEGKNPAMVEDAEAKEILATIFGKIKEDSMNDQRLDHPMFRVPDYFSGSVSTTDIGSFNVTTIQGSGFN